MANLAEEVTSGLLFGVTYTVHRDFHKAEKCLNERYRGLARGVCFEYSPHQPSAFLEGYVNGVIIGVAQLQPIQRHERACQP